MLDHTWDAAANARRPGRPAVLCTVLGVAAFGLTFCAALLLGRGLAGSALAALLLPLALSGAAAVGLAVAFVVVVALEQPAGLRKVSRLMTVAAPLAALVALFAYASDPAGTAGVPLAGDSQVIERPGARTPRRVVAVPDGSGTTAVPPATPPQPVVTGPVRPLAVGRVVRPVTATESPEPAEVVRPLPRFKAGYSPEVRAASWLRPAKAAKAAAKAARHAAKRLRRR